MLYKGNTATEAGGGSKVTAGAYKFKIEESKHYPSNESIGVRCKLWTDDNQLATEKFWFFISLKADQHESLKAETDRRLTVLLGKPEIASEKDLLGKSGYLVTRATFNGAEIMPFGGIYTSERKSATGNETMAERIQEALSYDWKQDSYAVNRKAKEDAKKGVSAPATEDSDSMPF
jgi:hypothetical protein